MPRGVERATAGAGVDAPTLLLREFLDWIAARPRSYEQVVEAWRSSCPRHPVLDDAFTDGLIRVVGGQVVLTPEGHAHRGHDGGQSPSRDFRHSVTQR
jgi:hypothetical protein